MSISWIGISTIMFVFLTAVLRLVNLGYISNWSIRIAPLIVMIILVIIASIVTAANNRRGTKEGKIWLSFIIASVLCFSAAVFEVLNGVSNVQNQATGMIGIVLFVLAYIAFITGLSIANSHFKGMRRINPWTPSIVIVITFGLAIFFLFRLMNTSDLNYTIRIVYTVFMVLDASLVALSWTLANRTWGGSLSISFIFIAFGCIGLSIFHVISVFFNIQNIYSIDSGIRVLFLIVLGLIAIGGDIRIAIENRLKEE